jgi:restriction endonuclease S subunit
MNINYQLPPGWKWKRLGDICDQIRGVSYKPDESSSSPQKGYIPLYRAHNIQESGLNKNELVYADSSKISPQQYIKNGDIVICASSGSKDLVGKAAQADEDSQFSFGAFCKVVRPKDVDKKYLGCFFKGNEYRQSISSVSVGTNINNIRNEDIDSLLIPLPPLSEQRRISAIIDAKLASVEKAKKVAEEQSVAANSYLRKVLENTFAKDNFSRWTKIDRCSTKVGSGATPRGGQKNYKISGYPFIRSQNVHFNRFITKGLAYIDEVQNTQLSGTVVQEGDVLLNITGASIGRVCVVPKELCPANVNQHVSIIRFNETIIPEFAAYYMANKSFQDTILQQQAGATRQALTKEQIQCFDIPCIEKSEQIRILASIKKKMENMNSVKSLLNEQSQYINALPASILRQAFNGEL